MTLEQENDEEKIIEQEEREAIALDNKFLREKCPTCEQKCNWYKENQGKPLTLEETNCTLEER